MSLAPKMNETTVQFGANENAIWRKWECYLTQNTMKSNNNKCIKMNKILQLSVSQYLTKHPQNSRILNGDKSIFEYAKPAKAFVK